MNKLLLILVGIIMTLFIVVIIYSVVISSGTEPEVTPDVPNYSIVTIAGEEYDIAITSLVIEWTPLTDEDLLQIGQLLNLTHLELKVCEISDISALSGLTNLVRLDLRFNSISNLTPLERLTGLTHLNLNHNNISDVRPLARLTGLVELQLGANMISDLSPLYDRLTSLKNLHVYDNNKDTIDEYSHGAAIRAGFPGATVHF
jgi:Leucine-rich repeat (LRR) protein